jgi:two-component system OmpR family sensor kinase
LRSIRRHLLAWLLGVLSLAAVALTMVLYAVTLEELGEVFDEQLKQVALTVLTHYEGRAPGSAALPPATGDLADSAFVTQVWSVDGRRLFVSAPSADIPFSAEEGTATVDGKDGPWRVHTDRSANYLIQAAQPLQVRRAAAADIAAKFLLASLATVPFLAWLLAVALGRGMRPLVQASEAVERRSAQSLAPIALDALPQEVRPLVGSVNSLMAKLSAALATQRRFTADAAHELRTPLTALRLQVQLLLSAPDEQTRQEAAADIRQGLVRATHLVQQLLSLSRVEPEGAAVPQSRIDLDRLVKDAVADFSVHADERRIDLGADIAAALRRDAHVLGDAEQLRVLVNNLIDNALRYTAAGGRVDVRVRDGERPGTLCLEVADSGPGIPGDERERVFDRFYRGRQPQGATGTGLGLAIVKAVADRHGASIVLGDGIASGSGSPGLAVRITLPRLDAEPGTRPR